MRHAIVEIRADLVDSQAASLQLSHRRRMRILVVSGTPDARAALERLLSDGASPACEVTDAASGAAAVLALQQGAAGPPDCLLVDELLPDMSALQLLATLTGPNGLPPCAVVVLTGSNPGPGGRALLRAGAHEHLEMSRLEATTLARAIDNAMDRCVLQHERHLRPNAAGERARRDAFFLSLSEALRGLIEPRQLKAAATRRLGEHLKASRVVYGEVRNGREVFLEQGYTDGVGQIDGEYQLDDYGAHLHAEFIAGRTIVVDDIARDPAYTAEQKAAYVELEMAANLTVPLLSGDTVIGLLGIYQSRPRHWSAADVNLAEETAERTAHAVQRAQSQASQAQSERRLQLALQAGSMGVWRWVPSTDALEIDGVLADIAGLPAAHPARTSGQPFLGLISPDDRSRVEADIARIMAEGGHYQNEFRFHRPDGRTVWLSGQAMAIDADGFLPRHLVGINCDITERKLHEGMLQASQNRVAQLIEMMPSFTAVVRGPCHVFELANAPYYALVGRGPEILGLTLIEALPELADQPFPALLDRVYQTGEPFSANSMAVWLTRNNGLLEELLVDFTYTALRDAAGEVDGILIHGIDRSAQVRAEREVVRNQRELQSLADNTPDILTRFDRQHRHLFVNAAVWRSTGFSAAHFLGKTNRELGMPPALCDAWEAALDAMFDTGQPQETEFDHMSLQGPRHYSARLVPEFGADGNVVQALNVTRDTTENKRAERLLRDADRRKDEFLATLAHELRNPLAPIRNGLAILRRNVAPLQVLQTVAMMDRQLSQLVNLVDDLLDLSRVSLDKIELRRQRLQVAAVIEAALEACRPAIDAKGHRMTIEPGGPDLVIDADRTRMVQVVVNLLTNAVKYTDPGGAIGVSAERDGESVVIRVSDDGVGISAEVLPTLWSLFTQVRDTLDKAQGGLGIGLSLVKKLVEMHQGSVDAVSGGLGQGSIFSVRLPLSTFPVPAQRADDERPAAERAATAPASANAARRRVLVVDDNVDSARSLALLLQSFGHDTAMAHDGLQALAAAGSFKPDLVLLDIGLPGIDGYEVARLLREDWPTGSMVLVAVTGWGSEEDKRRAKLAGFDHHLTKPVRIAAIEALLSAPSDSPVGQDTVW